MPRAQEAKMPAGVATVILSPPPTGSSTTLTTAITAPHTETIVQGVSEEATSAPTATNYTVTVTEPVTKVSTVTAAPETESNTITAAPEATTEMSTVTDENFAGPIGYHVVFMRGGRLHAPPPSSLPTHR